MQRQFRPRQMRRSRAQEVTSPERYRYEPDIRDQPRQTQVQPPKQVSSQSGLKATLGTPIPKSRADELFPKPQALSVKDTHLRDDPAYTKAIVVDGLSACTLNKKQECQLDHSQFFELVRALYIVYSRDKTFSHSISQAMFEYYCVVLLWRRLFYVTSESEMSRSQSHDFECHLPEMAVPAEISHYLDSLGNLTDPEGREWFIKIFELQGDSQHAGHFGKVSVMNHYMYETLPAPFVLFYRMAYDYAYTKSLIRNDPIPSEWDLPEELSPGIGLPNRNLLGWHKAVRLTQAQCELSASFVDEDGVALPDQIVNNIPLLKDVIMKVSTLLRTTKQMPDLNRVTSEVVFKGSVSQIPYQTRDLNEVGTGETGQRLLPLSSRLLHLKSYFNLSPNVSSAATVFRFRVQRTVKGNADCLCYTLINGDPPDGWLENADFVYNTTPRWNFPDFSGPYISGDVVAGLYVNKVRKISNLDPA